MNAWYNFSMSSPAFDVVVVIYFSHSHRYVVLFHCGYILYFLNAWREWTYFYVPFCHLYIHQWSVSLCFLFVYLFSNCIVCFQCWILRFLYIVYFNSVQLLSHVRFFVYLLVLYIVVCKYHKLLLSFRICNMCTPLAQGS